VIFDLRATNPPPDLWTFTAPEALGIGHATSAFASCGHARGLALACNGPARDIYLRRRGRCKIA
jgi:hypothetical protein